MPAAEPKAGARAPARVGKAAFAADGFGDIWGEDSFKIAYFKVLPCAQRMAHDWKLCPFVHPGESARRRSLDSHKYSAEMCPHARRGDACPTGDACRYAHNVFELWMHPDRFKTKLCTEGEACKRRAFPSDDGSDAGGASPPGASPAAAAAAAAGWAAGGSTPALREISSANDLASELQRVISFSSSEASHLAAGVHGAHSSQLQLLASPGSSFSGPHAFPHWAPAGLSPPPACALTPGALTPGALTPGASPPAAFPGARRAAPGAGGAGGGALRALLQEADESSASAAAAVAAALRAEAAAADAAGRAATYAATLGLSYLLPADPHHGGLPAGAAAAPPPAAPPLHLQRNNGFGAPPAAGDALGSPAAAAYYGYESLISPATSVAAAVSVSEHQPLLLGAAPAAPSAAAHAAALAALLGAPAAAPPALAVGGGRPAGGAWPQGGHLFY